MLAKGNGGSKGKGATGRGESGATGAVAGTHGRKKYHSRDDDDEWREEHEDELAKYAVAIATVGVARIGDPNDDEDDLPGVGPADSWDETWDVSAGETVTYSLSQPGWYRVGSKLTAEGDSHDFGWESVDAKIEAESNGYTIDSQWKMSPQL